MCTAARSREFGKEQLAVVLPASGWLVTTKWLSVIIHTRVFVQPVFLSRHAVFQWRYKLLLLCITAIPAPSNPRLPIAHRTKRTGATNGARRLSKMDDTPAHGDQMAKGTLPQQSERARLSFPRPDGGATFPHDNYYLQVSISWTTEPSEILCTMGAKQLETLSSPNDSPLSTRRESNTDQILFPNMTTRGPGTRSQSCFEITKAFGNSGF